MKFRHYLSLIFLVLTTLSFSQRGKYVRFQNIETAKFGEDYLSSLIWDKSGSFWAYNGHGIVRHNGNTKKEFPIDADDRTQFAGTQIIGFQKTAMDEFWITYADTNVITRLNPDKESFEHFVLPELWADSTSKSHVVRVKKDAEGQLWLCTWGSGLIKFNLGNGPNEVFIFGDKNLEESTVTHDAGQYVKDIAFQKDGTIFVTFFNGRVKKGKFSEVSYPGFFDPKTGHFEHIDVETIISSYPEKLQANIRVAIRIIHWVHQDDNGKFWLGSYSGLLYYDKEAGVIERIMEEGEDEYLQNQVNVLSYVKSGSELWITTYNKGVMVVDCNTKKVNFHYSDPVNSSSLTNNKTNGASIDPFGNIWIVNGTGMLSVYNPSIHKFHLMYWHDMDLQYSNRSSQSIPVNQMYVENSSAIFVSSKIGLLQYDFKSMDVVQKFQFDHIAKQHGRLRGFQHFKIMGDTVFLSFDTYPHNLVRSNRAFLKYDHAYGTGKIGFRHDPKIKRRIYVHSSKDQSRISEYLPGSKKLKTIMKLEGVEISETFSFVTNQGKWLFSEGDLLRGYSRFIICDEKDSSFKLFSPSQTESFFPDSLVKCALIRDGIDEILIGTSTALYTFNEVTYESEDISEKIGLRNNEGVNSMVEDDNGNIWLALSTELLCWNPKTDEHKRYDKTLGINVSNFLPAVGQKDELGNLYFASMYGILLFHPDDVRPPNHPLVVDVSSIFVNEKELEKDVDLFLKGDYELSYDQNNLEFDFHTNQVFELAPHTYSYQLEGQSERWVQCGANHKLRFDNLRHGDYKLHFKATNVYGVESEVYTIPFSINKPFWLTWWFIAFISLAGIGIIYLLVKGRMKALKKRSELLEQTVTERTAEVVEQKKEAEKQKEEAEHQKEIVEEKQKEITDSITYAKRIQDAILPSDELIQHHLPNSFVMYRPKDIVAGDFYWLEPLSEDEVVFAAADCTGHGVPGAMVSVVCNNALNRTVREFGLSEPGKLLDKTRELVIEQFEQSANPNTDAEGQTIKDGMDIAVCKLNKKEKIIQFAGANNPLWIIRNNELLETKGDKQPVGKFEPSNQFTNHEIKVNSGDTIYIFSDGYADQFGGEKGKKFKSSSLKKLLLSIHQLPLNQQLAALETNFDEWKGTFEQLDDVCVIGFKIK